MKIWPFNQKSFAQVENPQFNQLLKALYQYKIVSGIAVPVEDTPDAYLTEGYSGNSDVYSIINRITQMTGQAYFGLYRTENGKRVEVTDHELTKFTRQANPITSMSDFMADSLVYKLSIGNSFWYLPKLQAGANKGKSTEIWLMPSNNVEIVAGQSWMNPVGGYILNTNSTVKFQPEEVFHSKFFNPLFGENSTLYGQSPLKAASRVIAKMNKSEITELKQFENQGPPYILSKDGADMLGQHMSGEQINDIENQFKDYNKKYKTGQPIILGDKFNMIRLGVSPVDLNILESSQETRRVICNIFSLPSGLFNDLANLSYNQILDMGRMAWSNCCKPHCDTFARDLTSCLINQVPEYLKQGLYFAFDYSEIPELQGDFGKMVAWMKQAGYTMNEMREATGAKPLDNPLMNEVWVGMGESPISLMSDTTEPPALKNFGDYK